jgi:hypothetical protein
VPVYTPVGQVNLAVWLQWPSENYAALDQRRLAAGVQRTLVGFIWFVTRQPPLLSMPARELVAIATGAGSHRKRARSGN